MARIEHDAYFTPPALAAAIVARLVERGLLRPGMTVWEPHAGSGAFVRPLLLAGARVHASDLDPASEGLRVAGVEALLTGWDATHGWPWPGERPDWIIGNPPFGDAEAHVRALLPVARYGVAFITRQSFTATAKRADLAARVWQSWPISPRPSFTGGGTDAAEYNVLLWVNGHGIAERPFDPLTWSRS